MKIKLLPAIILCLSIIGCNNKRDAPNISSVKADFKVIRFDRDLFAIDSNNVLPGLNGLFQKYPQLTNLYLQNILGLDSSSTLAGVKHFLGISHHLYDTVNVVYPNNSIIEKEFERPFKYLKYYFPEYKVPDVVTVIGPMDALAQSDNGPTPDFLRPGLLGISLQFYLGNTFSLYSDPYFLENVAPAYISRRYSKEYMAADGMKLIVADIFPDKSNGKPLIEQMVEKGKQWYALDKLLPETPDSIKTGYTADQLAWCNANEGLIWSYLVKNEDLNSINPTIIQTYIGEGPFTQGFSQEDSPGNIGQWIGWQIVKKFAAKNAGMKIEEIMSTPARKIIEEAKYKPK